jgi:hypothetical protein
MANVYTTLSNATVYTDKLQISTGNTAAAGNLYSVPISIPANTVFETYSGAGNKVTIAGSNWTALELGTASSATAGVIGAGS